MERLRGKVDQSKTLLDTAKSVRIGMADKRHSLDIQDKEIVRKCLDTVQSSISVRSCSGMTEKLETIARQRKLKCIQNLQPPSLTHLFITSEAFYMDVVIDASGKVMKVNIHHQVSKGMGPNSSGTPNIQACPEIVDCLNKQEFDTFVKHLEGLNNVYDLNYSLLDKSRVWQVLVNLEDDLMRIYKVQQSQPWVKDLYQLIHKTGLGFVEGRAGGLPMKLRIFLPPFQLLDLEKKQLMPLTQATILEKDLGFTLTVGIKSSTYEHILPLTQAISSAGQEVPLGSANCVQLPAHFSLSFARPLPTSSAIIDLIESITKIQWVTRGGEEEQSLFSLISVQESEGTLDSSNNRGLFVTLPDQQHCYYLTDTPELTGQLISYVPFSHPSQVPRIVDVLRRQALFNSLVASCVRTTSLEDVDTSTMFEVTCVDPLCQSMMITFESSGDEEMSTAELLLEEITALRCKLYMAGLSNCGGDYAMMDGGTRGSTIETTVSKVLHQSLSIPITMRSILKKGQQQTARHIKSEGDGVGLARQDPTSQESPRRTNQGSHGSGGGGGGKKIKMEPGRGHYQGTVCHPGGGGGEGKVKQENESEYGTKTDSLNRLGPQGADSLPGALTISRTQPQFRHPTDRGSLGQKRRRSDGTSKGESSSSKGLDGVPPGISISKLQGPPYDKKPKHKHSKDEPIQPFVSITPISGRDQGEQSHKNQNSGIEIIPLGGAPSSSDSSKSKGRDFKRSLSMDDKRRIEKSEKRRKEEMKHRGSVSPSSSSSSSHKHKKDGDKLKLRDIENKVKDPKAKLAGVIERLAYQTGDTATGIEIHPTSKDDMKGLKMTFRNEKGSSSSSGQDPSKIHHKLTEKFVTNKEGSTDSKKDKQTVSLHIVKSPTSVNSSSLLPKDGLVKDPFLVGK